MVVKKIYRSMTSEKVDGDDGGGEHTDNQKVDLCNIFVSTDASHHLPLLQAAIHPT